MSLRINDSVVWQETAEGVSLYDIDTGAFTTLNATAARIWMLIDSDGEREPIVSKLSQEFAGGNTAVSRRIRADVQDFLGTMIERKLVEEHPA
ncbi:PqqD family protein [Sphaerisporangium album]|uniref:PqqD family protein n=1 Tax=Sphaerisporangium album TaxID=509200 RepID=A0A367FHN0_9ACTN|nr:PqqD family protein [Sphaerisporangium album]RCG29883.1 PqqD family protein [Sphaerisporangium album]